MASIFMGSKNKKTNSWKKRLLNTKITSLAQGVLEPQAYCREVPFGSFLVLTFFHKNLVLVIHKHKYWG